MTSHSKIAQFNWECVALLTCWIGSYLTIWKRAIRELNLTDRCKYLDASAPWHCKQLYSARSSRCLSQVGIARPRYTFSRNMSSVGSKFSIALRCWVRIIKPPWQSINQGRLHTRLDFFPLFKGNWRDLRLTRRRFWNGEKTVGAACAVLPPLSASLFM